jgi:hypothetical protein
MKPWGEDPDVLEPEVVVNFTSNGSIGADNVFDFMFDEEVV